MSDGTPIDKRHPIKGLEPGDRIAYVIVGRAPELTQRALARAILATHSRVREHDSDVLVVAFPRERRAAVLAALEEGTAS